MYLLYKEIKIRNLVVTISNPCKAIKLFVCMITPKCNMSFQSIVPQNYFSVFLGLFRLFLRPLVNHKNTPTHLQHTDFPSRYNAFSTWEGRNRNCKNTEVCNVRLLSQKKQELNHLKSHQIRLYHNSCIH